MACWPPVVTITSAGSAGSPRRSVKWRAIAARRAGHPSGKYPLVAVTGSALTAQGSASAAATCGAQSTAARVRSASSTEFSSRPAKKPLARCTAAGVVRCGTMRVPAPWRLSAMPSSRSTW